MPGKVRRLLSGASGGLGVGEGVVGGDGEGGELGGTGVGGEGNGVGGEGVGVGVDGGVAEDNPITVNTVDVV